MQLRSTVFYGQQHHNKPGQWQQLCTPALFRRHVAAWQTISGLTKNVTLGTHICKKTDPNTNHAQIHRYKNFRRKTHSCNVSWDLHFRITVCIFVLSRSTWRCPIRPKHFLQCWNKQLLCLNGLTVNFINWSFPYLQSKAIAKSTEKLKFLHEFGRCRQIGRRHFLLYT